MSDTEFAGKPDDWEELTAEEKQEWAEARQADLEAEADAAGELSDDEQAAFDALTDPLDEELATVNLRRDVDVQVKTYLSGEIEDNLMVISENTRDLQSVRSLMVETLAWMIEDDTYGSEKVWRKYADEYGVTSMAEIFFEVMEPALDRMEESEAAKKFRANR